MGRLFSVENRLAGGGDGRGFGNGQRFGDAGRLTGGGGWGEGQGRDGHGDRDSPCSGFANADLRFPATNHTFEGSGKSPTSDGPRSGQYGL